jgi:hypothetical protein
MCKITEKPLYASGAGFNSLIYFCATQGIQIKVINGNENGGKLKDLNKFLEDD